MVIAIIMYTWIRPTALRDPARETSAFQAKQPARSAGRQAGRRRVVAEERRIAMVGGEGRPVHINSTESREIEIMPASLAPPSEADCDELAKGLAAACLDDADVDMLIDDNPSHSHSQALDPGRRSRPGSR